MGKKKAKKTHAPKSKKRRTSSHGRYVLVGGGGDLATGFGPSTSKYPGEKHAFLVPESFRQKKGLLKKVKNLKNVATRANYAGPGTNIVARLQRGDLPVSETDRVAMAHDIRYGLARNYDQVRVADEKMLKALDNVERAKRDTKFNTRAAGAIIKAKMGLENRGLPRNFFAQHGESNTPEETALMKNTLSKLEQRGLGAMQPNPPIPWSSKIVMSRAGDYNYTKPMRWYTVFSKGRFV